MNLGRQFPNKFMPHRQDATGETALHKACRTGAAEVVEMLANFSADNTLTNTSNHTAAEVAAIAGHLQLAKFANGGNNSGKKCCYFGVFIIKPQVLI